MPKKRQDNGTFAPGNEGGPGRPKRATEAAYMAVVMSKCDLETWGAIVDKAVAAAKANDWRAREWLTQYLIGAPSPNLYAPKPTRVLALEELGDDGVDSEVARIQHDQVMQGLLHSPGMKRR